MVTNLAIAVVVTALIWFIGIGPFLLVQLPIALLVGSVGVWLFYVQHQFGETFWARGSDWKFHEASLRGSSYYDLPGVLRWFTANIGVHHVHHLCSRIPYYRLPQTLRDNPDLRSVGRLTLLQSLRCVRPVLWDESCSRLISFRGKKASILKILYWDGNGLCLFSKRLDQGGFVWPRMSEPGGTIALTLAQLAMLIEGIDWRNAGARVASCDRRLMRSHNSDSKTMACANGACSRASAHAIRSG